MEETEKAETTVSQTEERRNGARTEAVRRPACGAGRLTRTDRIGNHEQNPIPDVRGFRSDSSACVASRRRRTALLRSSSVFSVPPFVKPLSTPSLFPPRASYSNPQESLAERPPESKPD